jgi:hypothetical protein
VYWAEEYSTTDGGALIPVYATPRKADNSDQKVVFIFSEAGQGNAFWDPELRIAASSRTIVSFAVALLSLLVALVYQSGSVVVARQTTTQRKYIKFDYFI